MKRSSASVEREFADLLSQIDTATGPSFNDEMSLEVVELEAALRLGTVGDVGRILNSAYYTGGGTNEDY